MNQWVWLVGVVVRMYIDFLILLIPTPLVSVLFAAASLHFVHKKKMVFVLLYIGTNVNSLLTLGTQSLVCEYVCVSVRSFLPPRASRPRNIGTYVFTAT